eukprot:TRINITY_DN24946_c0_g2_i1.p1 TRINITY_DN24946_c0_g2~~TRINITY_DN24946_c0_g2_i1.p1  ORF type:complete len:806 (+),score=189.44 TRINITY_DN24946_c0_g2_i1:110-2527(+)
MSALLDANKAGPAALKEWFRSCDADRNGMIDQQELGAMLKKGSPDIEADTVVRLFEAIDTDGGGSISFDEFVDFVFAPNSPKSSGRTKSVSQLAKKIAKDVRLEELHEANMAEAQKPAPKEVMILGSRMQKDRNGPYKLEEQDWLVSACVGDVKVFEKAHLNGKGKFVLEGKKIADLFYGWTKPSKKTGESRAGWFIAKMAPAEGEAVTDFLLFNPSKNANLPSECCAHWETKDGRFDKRLFCEVKTPLDMIVDDWDGSGMDKCLDEEMWSEVDSEDLDDYSEDDSDEDWEAQPGESWRESDYAASFQGGGLATVPEEGGAGGPGGSEEPASEPAPENGALADGKLPEDVARLAAATRSATSAMMSTKASLKHKESLEFAGGSLSMAPGFQVNTAGGKLSIDESKRRGSGGHHKARKKSGIKAPTSPSGKTKKKVGPPTEEELAKYKDGFFVDLEFPPGPASLGDTQVPVDDWTRLSKIHEKSRLFYRIESDNILSSSAAGNAWFHSAMAAVAEYPSWVHSMFGRVESMTPDCRYTIRFFHPGRNAFFRVTVDDYVPTFKGSPAFAGVTPDGEIWVPLVEKAFAKLCGSYAATEWGEVCHGMAYLCGGDGGEKWERITSEGPSKWRRSATMWRGMELKDFSDRQKGESSYVDGTQRDPNAFWLTLRRYMERCFPVACKVDAEMLLRKPGSESGLHSDRLYSVIGAREVPRCDGRTLRMVLLANPFGYGQWKGRWGRKSKTWKENPSVGNILSFSLNESTALFWMSYTEFLKYMTFVSVARKSMSVQGCAEAKKIGLKRGLGLTWT